MPAWVRIVLLVLTCLVASTSAARAAPEKAAPVSSDPNTPATLAPGKQVRNTGSAPFTLYAIDGASGLWIHAQLSLAGDASLVLYDVDGATVLTVDGSDKISIDAVLSIDQVYYLAVIRSGANQPFSLDLRTEDPDLHLALFSMGIGYSTTNRDEASGQEYEVRSCWVEPGIKLRRIFPGGVEETTLGRGGKEYSAFKSRSGEIGSGEREIQFDGDRATIHTLSPQKSDMEIELESLFLISRDDQFHSYLCTANDN